jgi:hypothetical protein
LNDFRAKGYAGAWAWSLFSDKTNDKMRVDLNALATFGGGSRVVSPAPPPAVVPTAVPVQLRANWVSPTYASPGQPVTFHQDVVSTSDMSVLVDFEVYDDSGTKISQTALDNQSLSANTVTSFSTTWELPASLPAGQYVLKIGAFSAGWGRLLAWSDSAGAFVVEALALPTPPPSNQGASPTDTSAPESGDALN